MDKFHVGQMCPLSVSQLHMGKAGYKVVSNT